MRLLVTLISFAASCFSSTICLNMIVKNESRVIQRCLESVVPIIDSWVIVDTGSTDGTQQIIRDFLKEIPGELHERPWVHFGHNREEALKLAKGKADYILFMDADDTLSFEKDFQLPELTHDFYAVASTGRGIQCLLPRFIKSNLSWHWYDVLHEYVMADTETTGSILQGITYVYIADGARNCDPKKYENDIALLERAIQDHPEHTRYPFYLGQTSFIVGNFPKALQAFEKRAEMGGFEEEIFVSKLQIARIFEKMEKEPAQIENAYREAYRFRPVRLEPIYSLAARANKLGQYERAFKLASLGLLLSQRDTLFVEQWIYDYGIYYQYAIAAFHCDQYWEAMQAAQKVLSHSQTPDPERKTMTALQQKIASSHPETIQKKLKEIIDKK